MGVAVESHERLHLRVNDVPTLSAALMFGFQQAMLCLSGLLVYPFLVSEAVCAGDATVQLRVQLIAATFVSCGIATIIQTTFGLRLCVLHGPAMAFLPPLLAYKALRASECTFTEQDTVSADIWQGRLQEISGSLLVACISFFVIGGSGMAGALAKLIGPMTIVPLMILLTTSIVPTIESKLSLHWISLVMLVCIVGMAVYMEHLRVPIPYYSFNKKRVFTTKIRLFGQFPYLLSILLVWFICYLMTITGVEPVGGQARTDKNVTMMVLRESPWFQVPFPEEKTRPHDLPPNVGQFGMPRWSIGLCMGYVASCISSVIENIGSYDLLARVSQQRAPPKNAVNRAIMVEGLGSMLAAVMGVSTGVTTYAENIALIHITRVASRTTMQIAGVLLILLGLFTKMAALLASIPDALVGGVLTMGISMIAGVAMSNLQLIDLKLTRNLSILGLSLMIGLIVPLHLERSPFRSGNKEWDQIINMLLSIKMLVGGVVAVILDNTVPGATLRQRGLQALDEDEKKNTIEQEDEDGYAFPECINRVLRALPFLQLLPFLPSHPPPKPSPSREESISPTDSA
ncbi:putative permease [Ancylostoma ceylanicum]|uniref:Putative permease n=1 Tax=Ancylostoma ceylanicum TaxID=53326 RepID=A0A0D6M0S5_9BILA|nr:putative permease [Ancylostoma ceylanicum]